LKVLKCLSCGGNLNMYSTGSFLKCPWCDTIIKTDQEEKSWEGYEYKNSRYCPVCRYEDTLVLNRPKTKWKCMNCGYSITDKELQDVIYWFCDSCDAFLNVQPGFEKNQGTWKCLQCGSENDTTEENIFD